MNLFTRLFFGAGRFKPEMRSALDGEGVVVLEENLKAMLRYDHFRAPGKRFNGKVVPLRVALAVTERRLAVYAGSGRQQIIDTPYGNRRLAAMTVSTDADDRLLFHIDYERFDDTPDVSGEITLRVQTPNAAAIAQDLEARMARVA